MSVVKDVGYTKKRALVGEPVGARNSWSDKRGRKPTIIYVNGIRCVSMARAYNEAWATKPHHQRAFRLCLDTGAVYWNYLNLPYRLSYKPDPEEAPRESKPHRIGEPLIEKPCTHRLGHVEGRWE